LSPTVIASVDQSRLDAAYQTSLAALLAERTPDGYWIGELSTSALSTAVASSALALVQKAVAPGKYEAPIRGGVAWLAAHQNDDGGWGDTVKSFSNISTTMLCRAAFHLTGTAAEYHETLQGAEKHLSQRYGQTPQEVAEAVRRRYGKDRTFSVPILMTSALAGLVSWNEVPSLPVRVGLFSAGVVSLPAAAGRQLRAAGSHRHRTGGVSSSTAVGSVAARRAAVGAQQEFARPRSDSAVQRRFSRSGAADEFRRAGPGEYRASGSSRRDEMRRVSGAIGAAGRQLAD